jgi:sterol desaturase/sphingolipid hydroxylase (fatty acid hydroxylase superfamily)
MVSSDWIVSLISAATILGITLFIARQFEKRLPIEPEQSTAEIIVDWKLAGLRLVLGRLLSPVTNVCTLILVNAAGGGWIYLRCDGWWFLLSFILLILAIDFWSYLVHRAEHNFPCCGRCTRFTTARKP